MVGARGFAHDIEVANNDGKTIYYKYNTDGTSVSITYQGTSYSSYSNEYTGDVVISETVTYGGKTYSVTSIDSYAFSNCSGLTSVTIPNSVTSIGSSAFLGCNDLTSVTIPNSVTSIGDYAFHSCSGLTSVTIPNSVTSIGDYAFSFCSGLTSVTIPNSVTSIGDHAFYETAWYNNQPDGLVYAGNVAYKYKGTMPANTSITLKEGTVGIASEAFYGCSGLTSVTIPNSVTSIGESAFYNCSGLEKVIVQNIKNWCSIKFGNYYANPLYYAHHLYSDENTEITKLVIPDDVTSIGNYAFYGCSGLTSVTIPNSVTSIGEMAFYDCSGLEKVIVPNFDIKKWCSIDFGYDANPLEYAHHLYSDENTEITELVIPDDMTSISKYAFYGWNTYVVIPETINPYGAFSSNYLKYAIYKSKTPPVNKNKNFNPIAYMIFVPEESVLEYKTMQKEYMATVYPWVNADVEFYTKVTVDEYAKVMSDKDKATVTSVAMYDGMDENLTEAMMKDGMNPNCLYYIFSDKEITGDNIIDLKTCTANRIVLQSNNIFKCPVSFTATKAQFTYTPSVWANGFGGWETLCLPFEVSAFKASESGYISPILLGAYGDFWLRQFVGASSKALYFSSTLDGTMKANTPYLLAFPGSVMGNGHLQGQTITFLGKNVEFEANATAEVQRNDKVFVGNYDNVADDASGWILNSAGSDFITSSVVGDKPFRAYIRTEDDFADFNAAKTLNISFVEDEETAIREINEDRDAENDLNIYSIDGTLIRKAENTSDGLNGLKKGTYIINHKKVMIR
ncbi:MAG: leucine-rich repeat domain-containing protein [Prevotella sp.]|nr:leucine-rich repeat domain-containing protein [Prevotella sp.]